MRARAAALIVALVVLALLAALTVMSPATGLLAGGAVSVVVVAFGEEPGA